MTTSIRIEGLEAAWSPPVGGGPAPGVIVIHEIVGLNDDMRAVTDRLAAAGYAAVAPDLFSDGPTSLCVARTVLDASRGGLATGAKIESVRRWLAARPEVDGRPIGIIGFCMGGGFALTAAVRSDLAAASVNYGAVPDDLAGVCPVVASYGDRDRLFRSAAVTLEARLTALGVPHDVAVYPGVGHSFMNRYGGPLGRVFHPYDEAAAEDSWRRILDFFAVHLRQ
jgi:carboxymethylenebutenolidase